MKNSAKDVLRIKIFGRLVVIRRTYDSNNKKNIMWECLCECGNFKDVSTSSLMRGDTVSCGCFKKDRAKDLHINRKTKLPLGDSARNHLFYRYKHEAKTRGFVYELTLEDFMELTKGRCYYCDVSPKQICKPHKTGEYIYNGIDRIDSSLGYFKTNCVSSCGVCNRMKMDLTVQEFKDKLKAIYENLNLVGY